MLSARWSLIFILLMLAGESTLAQVVINEGTNRNYSVLSDENGDYPDWVELFNSGADTVNLLNYSLTDKIANPVKWVFPNVKLAPGRFLTIFCSGKDRKPVSGFVHVINTGTFVAQTGWNTHGLTTPFYWDGISNLLVNTCSYSSAGYTTNSVFNQTFTSFPSTVYAFQDGSPGACFAGYGTMVNYRPDMQLNGINVGIGNFQNSPYDYPAPYGNWYWGARNQMLLPAQELTEAGIGPGNISSLAFNVVSTDPNTTYDYIDIHMKLVSYTNVSSSFEPVDTNNFLHSNFKIAKEGETVYLFSPEQALLSQLFVECSDLDNSTGSFPDGSPAVYYFETATPSATNNNSSVYTGYLTTPVITVPSGFYNTPLSVTMINPNPSSTLHFTLDGDDPTPASPLYTGSAIPVASSTVLKAKAFSPGILPSPVTASTYFFDVEHTTPVLSVITDNSNLYGPSGIFDNWWYDWERNAYVEYFDSVNQLIFTQRAGIQVDGGAGGSRSNPQHSFRVELDDGVLGDGPINYPLIPNRPERTMYSKFYLRNGSNQYLVLPYKEACQVQILAAETNNYYSAWRPVSVYINGDYFGLYELREKFDTEYFGTLEGADPETTDILSVSYWYGGSLRAIAGNADSFYVAYDAFNALDPADTAFWIMADQYFDLTWYTDYIIGESWIGNSDWPWNNIKIYRSDMTGYRWRFCIIDPELALLPNGWTDCWFDHIEYMLGQSSSIPYMNIWLKSIQNDRFRHYFINRFADVMNTSYRQERLLALENHFYNLTETEMANEYGKWGDPWNIPQQMEAFFQNHLVFTSQLSLRTQQVRNHILENFSLTNQVYVNLNVVPEGGGTIRISTITPESYPWDGVYFNGVPVKIEAQPESGYSFHHWTPNPLITDTLNPVFHELLNTGEISFKAWFEPLVTNVLETSNDLSAIKIFPNPASQKLHLRMHGNLNQSLVNYQVMDIHGRILKQGAASFFTGESTIDIHSFKPSIYFLKLSVPGSEAVTKRFIKSGK